MVSQLDQAQQKIKILEIEKEVQFTELSNYKNKIEYLNEKIKNCSVETNDNSFEVHVKQKQCEEQFEKIKKDMKLVLDKFSVETKANNAKHQTEIKVIFIFLIFFSFIF